MNLPSEFLRKMVESVGVGVGIYNQDGEYIYVNDSYAELFDASPSDLIGVTIWKIAPEIDPDTFDAYWDSFADGETREAETVHTFNGREVPVATVTTQRTINGKEYHFGTIKDITERKAREREIKEQNERLENFAGLVSHDLRNPMNVAQGYIELLQEDIDRSELNLVENSLERMESLVTELLQLARSNAPVGETSPTSLFDTATNAWSSVETDEADLRLSGADMQILADESRLRELFENLFRNAVEHAGSDVAVTVESQPNGFLIADSGTGIPSEDREKVFETGFTTNKHGTGFGLDIVQQIVTGHEWEIQITESDSGGAQFEITGVDLVE
ncbi:MAG: PAS domain-containing sensor histidine kinase [Halobacteriales archaeon]|nr:PAS domain-containing sensor histidine kinase [Halobacteriales archaeon]